MKDGAELLRGSPVTKTASEGNVTAKARICMFIHMCLYRNTCTMTMSCRACDICFGTTTLFLCDRGSAAPSGPQLDGEGDELGVLLDEGALRRWRVHGSDQADTSQVPYHSSMLPGW